MLGRFLRRRIERSATPNRLGFEPLEPRLALTNVVISEILAVNLTGLQDEDGSRSDWIELHNATGAAVDLNGWHLTDDANDLAKWTFPTATVAAGEYFIIFASGKDRANAGQNLHANFALDASGEYLALVKPDGVTIADLFNPFPEQVADISYGRGGQPSTAIGYMATPTPGAANHPSALGIVGDTNFSVDRGFYSSPFTVEITTETPGAEIRYTTDGSAPTATSGIVYDSASPPLISGTTTLRAAAFKSGYLPTDVDTQTYLFMDQIVQQSGDGLPPTAAWGYAGPDWEMDPAVVNDPAYATTIIGDLLSVPTISLVMSWDDWFGDGGQGIYPTAGEIERAVSMEYITVDSANQFQINAGIEIQGGTSDDRWKMDKLSMRVKFTEPYGPEKLDAAIFTGGGRDAGAAVRFNTLILDAHQNYTWAYGGPINPVDQRSRGMLIQDAYVADLQNLAGGFAPHSRFVHLYLNGLYWGLYDVHERPDEHFAESYLSGEDEDYDVVKHNASTVVSADAENPNSAVANYSAMLSLVRQNMSVNANYEAVAAKLDVDDFITYMLVNHYVGNEDWAHHNWYATFNRAEGDGRWRYHSWDAEHVLKDLHADITTRYDTGGPTEVFSRLMASVEFRLRLNDVAQKLMRNDGVLTPAGAASAYQARISEADRAIVGESARWGDNHTTASDPPGAGNPYTRDHWVERQDSLLNNYFPFRTDIVLGQYAARGWKATLAAPDLSQYGGTVAAGTEVTISKPASAPAGAVLYYTDDGSDPRLPGGGVASSAIAAAGGQTQITVDQGLQIRARIYHVGQAGVANDWSPEIEATFALDASFPLRITELNYNPAPLSGVVDEQDLEFIELQNIGTAAVSLDGVRITEFSDAGFAFPAGLSLGAGERMVVARSPGVLASAYGLNVNVVAAGYDGNLSNGGERIVLLGPLGEVLQDFTYDDAADWPAPSDGNGKSLEIIDPAENPADASNWRASYYAGGSPATAGEPPQLMGDFTDDDRVDGRDLLAWQIGFGTLALQGANAAGDADGDRDVDEEDLMRWLENYGAHVVGASVAASAPARANDASITGEARTNIHATLRAFASAGGWALAAHENAAAMNDKPRRRQHAAELIDEAFATYEIAPQPRTTNASVAARSPRSNRWEDGRYHHLQPSVYRVEYEEAFTSIRSGETLHAGRYSCIS